jgi:Carboxypeptidase regulatory-like domain/TonB-dependent Receptor Plug Domain
MMPARAYLVAAFLAAAIPLHGQQSSARSPVPTVAGVVRDVSGLPVPDVEVGVFRDNHLQQFVLTDAAGKFLLSGMGDGVVPVRFRRLGYAMQFKNIDSRIPTSSALDIVLTTVPSELQDVTVAGNDLVKLHEFFEHRQQRGSFGLFYEQSDIQRMGATQPSDLFRMVPGMVISTGSGGNVMRIRGCQPMVWVDGQRVPGAELDEVIHPQEIAAIEFYPSNAGVPPQYMERGNRLCGLVLVWTKTR